MILVHLPYFDLLRCTLVSHTWRTIIDRSLKLRRLLYKESTPISSPDPNPNPHLEPVSAETSAITISHGRYAGTTVVAAAQADLKTFLYRRTTRKLFEECADQAMDELWESADLIRKEFPEDTQANPWPRGLREIYCRSCESFHPSLRPENLHPPSSFMNVQARHSQADGHQVTIESFFVRSPIQVPVGDWSQYVTKTLAHFRAVRYAVDNMTRAGLQDDQFLKTIGTDLELNGLVSGRK